MREEEDMPNITILLAGVLGVGKTTIFKRIETGEFVQCPSPAVVSKSDLEAKHFIYTDNIEGKDYKVRPLLYTACKSTASCVAGHG